MKRMKILITGGWGQLGWDCREMFEPEHETLALDLPNLDITDAASVSGVLRLWRPDAIINCAAYTAVDRAEEDADNARKVNCDGPALLAELAAVRHIRLIHISTDYVFDGCRAIPQPYLETDAPNPAGVYGRTKLEGEQKIQAINQDAAILRTAWLYGGHGHNFLKTILRRAVTVPERGLKVVNDQFGTPTWSWRLAEQIRTALQVEASGIFHASGEGFCSWWEFATEFIGLMGLDCEVRPCSLAEYPTAAVRPSNSILENARLKATGWNVMRDWREDLREFVARYKDEWIREIST